MVYLESRPIVGSIDDATILLDVVWITSLVVGKIWIRVEVSTTAVEVVTMRCVLESGAVDSIVIEVLSPVICWKLLNKCCVLIEIDVEEEGFISECEILGVIIKVEDHADFMVEVIKFDVGVVRVVDI